ncbi:MAG: alpha/beta hydrolase [Chloroflexi bacterium]|nr:alpha/beta hydrolase [Chloroflexota bacterium]
MTGKPLSRFVTVGPHRLHYVEFPGAADSHNRPPVVLIPGLFSSHRQWARLVPFLNPPFRVLAFDYLGVGRSDKPADFSYTAASQAEVLYQAFQELEIERAHLIGASYGGGIALTLAGEHPEKVVTVTAIEGVFYWWGLMRVYHVLRLALATPLIGPLIFRLFIPLLIVVAWVRGLLILRHSPGEELRALKDCYLEPHAERRAWVNLLRTVGEDLRPNVGRVRDPILYLVGQMSHVRPFLTPALDFLRQAQPSARILFIPRGMHDLNVQLPEAIAPKILAFWQECR